MASYASKQSTAIDYQRFAPGQEELAPPPLAVLPQGERRKKKSQVRVPYVKYAAVALCVFSVLAVIVFSYMMESQLTVENDRLRSEISALESRENFLIAKKEQLYSLSYVEEYAKNNLGMVKLDKSDINYLELQNPERMTAGAGLGSEAEGEGAVISRLARSFSVVLEYLN